MNRPDNFRDISRRRIIELIEEFCGSEHDRKQQAFADMCDVSKFSISQYVNGSNAPGNLTAAKIARKCNVNPLWVMGFDVQKHTNKLNADAKSEQQNCYTDDTTAELAQAMASNPELKALFDVQRNMDPEDLKALYNMALALRRKEERLDSDDPA